MTSPVHPERAENGAVDGSTIGRIRSSVVVFSLIVALVAAISPFSATSETWNPNTLNGQKLPKIEPGNPYSFIVLGHTYGRSASQHNFPHHWPAKSLLANIDLIRTLEPDFIVLLGDIVWRMEAKWIEALQQKFMHPIGVPVVNAIGNHDITRETRDNRVVLDRSAYTNRFGNTFFSFKVSHDLHVILDTQVNNLSIKGKQYEFLLRTIERAQNSDAIRNVFFWSHHLVWTQIDKRYFVLKGRPGNWNFADEIYPLLLKLAKQKKVYWGSGNFGQPPNPSLFYDNRKKENITLFATGIGDTRNDLLLNVTVDEKSDATIAPVSLTASVPKPIGQYDIAYNRRVLDRWLNLDWSFLLTPPRISPPDTMEKLGIILSTRFFWHGVVAALIFCIGIFLSMLIFGKARRKQTSKHVDYEET